MKTKNQFYALQATISNGEKLLCWKDKKHFYFGHGIKGLSKAPAPTLFSTRKEANDAWDKVPAKGGNMRQFDEVIEAKSVRVVKVKLSV